jgi:tetratricopeptide (TPR) repeat protein
LQISEDLIAWTENPSPLVAVVRCRALMERANFLRILDDREGAYAGLAEASRELEANGITDPLELARQEELLGTLEAYCGHMERARRLLRKALFKVRRWGDNYTLQRVLISAGLFEIYSDSHDEAQTLLEEAMRTEEPDALLLRYAATNRVLGYFAGGSPQRAYQALLGVRARLGDSWLQNLPRPLQTRQMWLEGQILNALGMDEDAIGYLKKAREVYIRAACGYEVCYTSIDLVLAYAAQRRFAEVQRELTFALPFCSEQRPVDRHGKEAVQLLLRTLRRQGRLETDQIRAVGSRLEWILRAPLQTFPQPLFAELQM